jgi:hypothetical protein
MGRKKIVTLLVGGVLTLAAVFGAVSYRTVFAQAATATPSTTPKYGVRSATTTQAQPDRGPGMRGGEYSEQALANALGIDLTKLQAAEQSAATEALKQAVSAGLITQAQADQFAQDSTNGRPFDGMRWLKDSTIDYNTLLANALGISTDDLAAGKQKAYDASIDAAVTSGNMTQEQADAAKGRYALSNSAKFQASMKSAYDAAVQQAVTDGLITQAQADLLKAENAKGAGFGGEMGFGGHGGPGGRGGPDGVAPANQANPTTAAPTTTS